MPQHASACPKPMHATPGVLGQTWAPAGLAMRSVPGGSCGILPSWLFFATAVPGLCCLGWFAPSPRCFWRFRMRTRVDRGFGRFRLCAAGNFLRSSSVSVRDISVFGRILGSGSLHFTQTSGINFGRCGRWRARAISACFKGARIRRGIFFWAVRPLELCTIPAVPRPMQPTWDPAHLLDWAQPLSCRPAHRFRCVSLNTAGAAAPYGGHSGPFRQTCGPFGPQADFGCLGSPLVP